MNKVRWLLQENMKNQLSLKQMIEALDRIDVEFQTISLRPFKADIPKAAFPKDETKIICWGPSFIPRALKHPSLSPGIWYDHKKFRWSIFQENWGDFMLSSNGKVMSFNMAMSGLTSAPVFIRPDEDTKAFDGGLYSRERPPELNNRFGDIQVVVASVQPVQDEWRFFVVNQDIVESSSYRVMGQPNIQGIVPPEAITLAKRAIRKWGPSKVYCLDVGLSNGRLGIIESNCFNASRLYGANPAVVARAVSEFVCA